MALGCLAYASSYLLLCERSADEPSGYRGIAGERLVRGYRWTWCEVAYLPMAAIEGVLRGRRVSLVCDPDWLPER